MVHSFVGGWGAVKLQPAYGDLVGFSRQKMSRDGLPLTAFLWQNTGIR